MLGSPRVPDLHRILIPPTFAIDLLISMIDLPFILGPTMEEHGVLVVYDLSASEDCKPEADEKRDVRNV